MDAHRNHDPAATRVAERVETGRIDLVRFLHADHDGIVRGMATSGRRIADRLHDGIEYPGGVLSLLDTPVAGEPVRLMADPATYTPLPYAPGAAALLADLVRPDGEPWEACPRTFLKSAVAELSVAGFSLYAGYAPEFTLGRRVPADDGPDRLVPIDDSLGYAGFHAAHEYVTALVRDLEAQGVQVETYHPEVGSGRQALATRPAHPLRAADNHVLCRETVRAVATRQDLWATLAPRPIPGQPGNGAPLHLSLWADGRDTLDETGPADEGRWFLGGLLAHLPALTALTAASVNSFRQPTGPQAAVRIGPDAARITYRPSDSTANPYLALGALIHAGLDGIRGRTEPASGTPRLPATLGEALGALEADDLLTTVLGPRMSAAYLATKRIDIEAFSGQDAELEYFHHFTKF